MIGLPKSTEFGRKIPKKKLYEKLNVDSPLKRAFVEQISGVYWQNKLAPSTIRLPAGRNVAEIEVLEIRLTGAHLDEVVLRRLDTYIPYHLLFLLENCGRYQAWISYKEVSASDPAKFKVDRFYHTDWMQESVLPLAVEGLNLDQVYENFVRQVAGTDLISSPSDGETLKESVEKSVRRLALEKKISALQTKIRREKQLNKRMQMNAELKKLKLELTRV